MRELFSEAYSGYYAAAEALAQKGAVTKKELYALLSSYLSPDGVMEAQTEIEEGKWGFLRQEQGGYRSLLSGSPVQALTELERMFLRTAVDDPRALLFLTDEQAARIKTLLGDTEPLFRPDEFSSYDRSHPGDDYASPEYRCNFRALSAILEDGGWAVIQYVSPRGKTTWETLRPRFIEYSGKDDRFRLRAVQRDGRESIYNFARIRSVKPTAAPLYPPAHIKEPKLCAEPLDIIVTKERSAFERFMREFSYLKKKQYWTAAKPM